MGGTGGRQALAAAALPGPDTSPIKHVVVFLQENHTFDNVLGTWCAQTQRCHGQGVGSTVSTTSGPRAIHQAADFVPNVGHGVDSQLAAWNGGQNNGWPKVSGCKAPGYNCLTAFTPAQVPAITGLAGSYALSDETFTFALHQSWADHFEWFTSGDSLGFRGDNPVPAKGVKTGPGWGCNSKKVAPWGPNNILVPSCIPDPRSGKPNGGAFRTTPVPTSKSLADDCEATPGCSWRVYNTANIWSIVDTFAYLHYKDRRVAPTNQFLSDARSGTLPSLSFLTPNFSGYATHTSQHNQTSMAAGDQAIAAAVNAVMRGPEATSTVIFLTYDDCGCFYDSQGPGRVPMVIISPWVRPGFVDSTRTTFAGVERFAEITLGMHPLNSDDATAYPYTNVFDFSSGRTLVDLPRLPVAQIPATTYEQLRKNPEAVSAADDDVS